MSESLKDKLYFSLPHQLQDVLVSMYGSKLYRQRYSAPFSTLLNEIARVENRLSVNEIQEYQFARLLKILTHAQKNVPYYHALFKKIGLKINKFQDMSDLVKIPPLEKEVFRAAPDDFRSKREADKVYFVQKTSGSTGKPLEVDVDEETYKIAMAALVHHEQSNNVKMGQARATFAGRMIQRIDDNRPPFCRFNKAENQMLFSSYHINEKNIPYYVEELNRFKPAEIIGYPSAIYSLAFTMLQVNLKLEFKPELIVTNSETLLDWQREIIESVFSAPVCDYYGTAEYIVFARQCKSLNYHINPVLGLLEVVDALHQPLYDEEGDILCTSLSNYAMPLIRYRIGDRAVKSSCPCVCGQGTETLKKVVGRIDDFILTTDNRKIGRMDHIYKGLSDIKESQIVQTDARHCIIKVVPSSSGTIDEQALRRNFAERVGADMSVTVECLTQIPKGKNGKFKAVVNLMP